TQRINNGGNTYETSWSYQHSSSVFGPRSRWSGVRTGAARAGRTESQARPARREAGATCRKARGKTSGARGEEHQAGSKARGEEHQAGRKQRKARERQAGREKRRW